MLLRITLLTACALFAAIAGVARADGIPHLDGRIVGGEATPITARPYQVSMRYKTCDVCAFSHLCGGSLVDNGKAVIFAAHCADGRNATNWMAVAGTENRNGADGIPVLVDRFVIHEEFNALTFNHDVAVAFLSVPMPTNEYSIRTIDIVSVAPEPNTPATVSGWGTTSEGGVSSNKLQVVTVPIVAKDQCREAYSEESITDNMLCAGHPTGGKDACQGDSGGPLVAEGKLVGVVSWGLGCARPEYPGVYADVAAHYDWLRLVIFNIPIPSPTPQTTATTPTTPSPTTPTATTPTGTTPTATTPTGTTPTETTPTRTTATGTTPTGTTPTGTTATGTTATGTTPTPIPTPTPQPGESQFAFY